MRRPETIAITCNGANLPARDARGSKLRRSLDYNASPSGQPNIRLELPQFVRKVRYLPERVLDLLEIAAYVYCADRSLKRGQTRAVEYSGWARSLHFHVRVRDFAFWSQGDVGALLSRALRFMSGDAGYAFTFHAGHATPATGLFDSQRYMPASERKQSVVLFSGGLDSLAGTIRRLEESDADVLLVSHQSQPGTIRTQQRLVRALQSSHPGRISHYRFRCSLKSARAEEESQRTRAFLYASIACAIMEAYGQDKLFVYENGITSINLPRREDLGNARASRTTHPQTIHHLQALYSRIVERPMEILTPFSWRTKADVMDSLNSPTGRTLISSTVSCSKTFKNLGSATHCGGCSQCIDRRFAAYAAGVDATDHVGLYAEDLIEGEIEKEARTGAVDYVRQARQFGTWNLDHFHDALVSELAEVVDFLPGVSSELVAVERLWQLCRRHGQQVAVGLRRMRERHDDPYLPVREGSLLKVIADREYLRDPRARLVKALVGVLSASLGKMFSTTRPANEADMNIKVSALLDSHRLRLKREHPVVEFAGGHAVADHGSPNGRVLVEAKYIRRGTPPSKASEGMAADLTKYSQDAHILFVVYDPDRAIKEDAGFVQDFEDRGRCTVLIIR